jgi:hypothetical protein
MISNNGDLQSLTPQTFAKNHCVRESSNADELQTRGGLFNQCSGCGAASLLAGVLAGAGLVGGGHPLKVEGFYLNKQRKT